jgi:hypothetical protein
MEITLEVLTDANTDATTGDYPLEQASFSEHVRPPGANPHGPGHRVVFSDNLLLKKVDPQDPGPPAKPVFELGKGLPKQKEPEKRRVGTQSGFVTTIRFVMAGDDFLPAGTGLFQYEGTYRLNAFTHAGTTVLKAGQITARGVALLGADFKPFPPGAYLRLRSSAGRAPTPTLADRSPSPATSAQSASSIHRSIRRSRSSSRTDTRRRRPRAVTPRRPHGRKRPFGSRHVENRLRPARPGNTAALQRLRRSEGLDRPPFVGPAAAMRVGLVSPTCSWSG